MELRVSDTQYGVAFSTHDLQKYQRRRRQLVRFSRNDFWNATKGAHWKPVASYYTLNLLNSWSQGITACYENCGHGNGEMQILIRLAQSTCRVPGIMILYTFFETIHLALQGQIDIHWKLELRALWDESWIYVGRSYAHISVLPKRFVSIINFELRNAHTW